MNWAYVSGKVGGVKVDAGRQNFKTHTGYILDSEYDGIKASYGKDVKLTGYVGKGTDTGDGNWGLTKDDDRLYIADLSAKLGVVDAYVSYYNIDNGAAQEIYNVGASVPVVSDLKLNAEWMYGTADDDSDMDNNGWVAGLAYKGAKASKAGSWGLFANYFDLPALTYVKSTINTQLGEAPKNWQADNLDGYEGYEVGANLAVAKNIVATVRYADLESREGNEDDQVLWSELVFTF